MTSRKPEAILNLRRQLAAEIVRSLGPMSEYTIAPHFGIPQPRMSELNRGNVDRCSLEWLIARIHRLGGTVRIEVSLGDAGREWMRSRLMARRALSGRWWERGRCTPPPP